MDERFAGKVAIVTGAGSGIGEATARAFVDEGAAVLLVDSVEEKVRAVADSLRRAARSPCAPTWPTRQRGRRSCPQRSTAGTGSTSS